MRRAPHYAFERGTADPNVFARTPRHPVPFLAVFAVLAALRAVAAPLLSLPPSDPRGLSVRDSPYFAFPPRLPRLLFRADVSETRTEEPRSA